MALSQKIIEFTTRTTTGTQVHTVGFYATVILLFASRQTADGTGATASQYIGCITKDATVPGAGLMQKAFAASVKDATNNANVKGAQGVDKALLLLEDSGATAVEADCTDVGTTTFTLNYTTVDGSAYQVTALCLGASGGTGGAVRSAEIVEILGPTATGNQTISGLWGDPDAVLFVGASHIVNTSDNTNACSLFLGWAKSSTERGVCGFNTQPTATHANGVTQQTNKCIAIPKSDGSGILYAADLVSLGTNEFTINWTTVFGAGYQPYLWAVVLYTDAQIATFSNSSPGSTGDQDNALAFDPEVCLIQSWGKAASSSATTGISNSIGVSDVTNNRVAAFIDENNVSKSTNADRATSGSKALQCWTPGTPTKIVEAAVTDFTAQVRLNFTTVDGTGREYIGIAFGDAAAALAPLWQLAAPGLSPTADNLIWELGP